MHEIKYKIYVAGVKRNWRGDDLVKKLDLSNLNHEVIWGVDKKDLMDSDSRIKKNQKYLYGRNLTKGEIACSISHSLIIRKAKEEQLDYAIILEDDALVSTDKLNKFIENLQIRKSALISLYHDRRTEALIKNSKKSRNLFRHYLPPTGTVGYCLTRKAILQISKNTTESKIRTCQADFPLFYFFNIKFYSVNPKVVDHNDSIESIIDKRNTFIESQFRKIRIYKLLIGMFPFSWRMSIGTFRQYLLFLIRLRAFRTKD